MSRTKSLELEGWREKGGVSGWLNYSRKRVVQWLMKKRSIGCIRKTSAVPPYKTLHWAPKISPAELPWTSEGRCACNKRFVEGRHFVGKGLMQLIWRRMTIFEICWNATYWNANDLWSGGKWDGKNLLKFVVFAGNFHIGNVEGVEIDCTRNANKPFVRDTNRIQSVSVAQKHTRRHNECCTVPLFNTTRCPYA